MSSDTASIPTSTPKAPAAADKVLRENFLDFSAINRETWGKFKRPQSAKKNRPSKENSFRSKQRRSPEKENYMEKRRLQAIEAMKIAEQRRLRLHQEESNEDESLVESMANVSISSIEYLPDGRIRLSRKELNARREKHRRIKEQLAVQEARKKAEEASKKNPRRKIAFRPKSFAWEPRPVFKTNGFRNKCYQRAQIEKKEEEKAQAQAPPQVLRYGKALYEHS